MYGEKRKIMSKKQILSSVLLLFCLFLSVPAKALDFKKQVDFKVASVDVSRVVVNAAKVKSLKAEQQNKISELQTFITNAKADLAKEKNEAKRKTLEAGYNKQLNDKKAEIDKNYALKLAEIDKTIMQTIEKEAKKMGYNLVLPKTSVLYGAEDITEQIINLVK